MNTILTKEQEIKSYMSLLGISKREAEKLWEDDHSDEVLPEVAEMEKKAKEIKRYEKSDAPRKKTERKRKEDPIKREIISTLAKNLTRVVIDGDNDELLSPSPIFIENPEKEITFMLKGESYSVTLTKHRPKKKER